MTETKERRRNAMRLAAEFGYQACERGDNLQKMLADLEKLFTESDNRPAISETIRLEVVTKNKS